MGEFDRRILKDRRVRPTPPLSKFTFWGQRRTFRRKDDQQRGGYIDRYSWGLFFLLILIVGLNILDALFTMIILDFGGWEVNRIVDSVIIMLWRQILGVEIWLRFCLSNSIMSAQWI